jgi:hypothetical protein
MVHPPFSVEPVRSSTDLAAAGRLFEAYASSLSIDLAYQDFRAELATLSGKYAPPLGGSSWRVTTTPGRWGASRCGRWRPTAAAK